MEIVNEELNIDEMEAVAGGTSNSEKVQLPCMHTVSGGENLWAIAKKYYGTGAKWQKIYDANKNVIGDNPDLIKPGMNLTIPA